MTWPTRLPGAWCVATTITMIAGCTGGASSGGWSATGGGGWSLAGGGAGGARYGGPGGFPGSDGGTASSGGSAFGTSSGSSCAQASVGTKIPYQSCTDLTACSPGSVCVGTYGSLGYCRPICSFDSECTDPTYPNLRCVSLPCSNATKATVNVCDDYKSPTDSLTQDYDSTACCPLWGGPSSTSGPCTPNTAPNNCVAAVSLPCNATSCCPSSAPFACLFNRSCYPSANAAMAACGSSCLACQ
jgi:hypothetical protein